MVRLISVLAVVVAVLAFAAPSAEAGDRGHFRGEITRIDAEHGVFQLTHGDRSVTVRTGDRTRIFVDGHRARFGELEIGMKARVRGRWHRNDNGDRFLRARVVRAHSADDRR